MNRTTTGWKAGIVFIVALSLCATYYGLWHFWVWRDRWSFIPGGIILFGSMPWSMPWLSQLDAASSLGKTFRYVSELAILSTGFSVNCALIYALFAVARKTVRSPIGKDAWNWWQGQRLAYNKGLVTAGAIAFSLFVASFECFRDRLPQEAEITLFTIAGQAIGFLVMVGLANAFYCLGPFAEIVLKPRDAAQFRHRLFRAGLWFSMALPLSLPLLFFIGGFVGWWGD